MAQRGKRGEYKKETKPRTYKQGRQPPTRAPEAVKTEMRAVLEAKNFEPHETAPPKKLYLQILRHGLKVPSAVATWAKKANLS